MRDEEKGEGGKEERGGICEVVRREEGWMVSKSLEDEKDRKGGKEGEGRDRGGGGGMEW